MSIEFTQKKNKKETLLDLFSEIFPFVDRVIPVAISIDDDEWTGQFLKDEKASKSFKVTNNGFKAVTIFLKTPDAAICDPDRLNISAGDSEQFVVRLDTTEERIISDSIYLLTGEEDAYKEIKLELGVLPARPTIEISDASWEDVVLKGSQARKKFRLTNTGDADFSGGITTPEWATSDKESLSIPAGESAEFTVNLDTTQDRRLQGEISIEDVEFPIRIDVVVGAPKMRFIPASMDEILDTTEPATRSVTIYNDGQFDLDINIDTQSIPNWLKIGETHITISPGASHSVDLQIQIPSPGVWEATLGITSNDPDKQASRYDVKVSAVNVLVPLLMITAYDVPKKKEYDHYRLQRIDADGNLIVYVLSKDGNDFLFLMDVITKENKIISVGPDPSESPTVEIPCPPGIHGGKVVYYMSAGEHSGIYVYEVETGRNTRILAGGNVNGVDIYDDKVVYCLAAQIHLYTLSDGHDRTLRAEKAEVWDSSRRLHVRTVYRYPSIHGDTIRWIRYEWETVVYWFRRFTLMGYSLERDRAYAIEEKTERKWEDSLIQPRVDNMTFAYWLNGAIPGEYWEKDVMLGLERFDIPFDTHFRRSLPSVGDHGIVYIGYVMDQGSETLEIGGTKLQVDAEIYIYDVYVGGEISLTEGAEPVQQILPGIGENYVVWFDHRDGLSLYAFFFGD